jgi:hypothetical protein
MVIFMRIVRLAQRSIMAESVLLFKRFLNRFRFWRGSSTSVDGLNRSSKSFELQYWQAPRIASLNPFYYGY